MRSVPDGRVRLDALTSGTAIRNGRPALGWRSFRNALALVSCLGALPFGTLGAGSASNSVALTMTVVATCSITAGAGIAFSGYTGAVKNAPGGVVATVACSGGSVGAVTLGNGLNYNGVTLKRQMASGVNRLPYRIFTTNLYSTPWEGATSVAAPGSSSTTLTGWGQIPAGSIPVSGTYSDTVVLTVTF